MTFRIAQISDTHLSGERPFFVANFECVARAIAGERPDLVVNTGDVSLDGVGRESDLAAARRLHDKLGLPMRFVPGNHDVGDGPDVPNSHEFTIDAARRERYLRHFGNDWWSVDVPAWRLIGVDAQLLGSDLRAADEQDEFIADAAAGAKGREIALFIHKPLFDLADDEDAVGGRFLNPALRRRLRAALFLRRPTLVASGHVHQYRTMQSPSGCHVWAPSTAFFIPDVRQPRYGLKQVGYVTHELREDGTHESRFVQAPGTDDLNIAHFPAAYGEMV